MTTTPHLDPTINQSDDALIRRVLRRLIPFLILCFLMNMIDRSTANVAQNSMIAHVPGMTEAAFRMGLGLFYIPYCLLELPSILLQRKYGDRRWIARIMITWGIASTCFVFTYSPALFTIWRVLLGIAEAGFFPGIILYLTYWVPRHYRARASALFFLSTAFAGVIGNSLGGYILYLAGEYNLPGQPWQWLFPLEGIPSIIVGVAVLFYLTNRPAEAKWLSASERERLGTIMDKDREEVEKSSAGSSGHGVSDFAHAFLSPYTWTLSLLYSLMNLAYNPVQFFMNPIFKNVLHDSGVLVYPADVLKATTTNPATTLVATPERIMNLYTGLLSAIPFGIAAILMLFIARHSDRHNRRKPHLMFTCGCMCVGLLIAAFAPYIGGNETVITVAGLSLAAVGWFGAFATFWALPAQLMTGTAVAAALAVINSIGNLVGNFIGSNLKSWLHVNDMGFLLTTSGCALLGVIVTAMIRFPQSSQTPGTLQPANTSTKSANPAH